MNKLLLLLTGWGNIAKGKCKQKLAGWTEDAIEFAEGKTDELVGRIQSRTAQAAKPELGPGACPGCRHQPR